MHLYKVCDYAKMIGDGIRTGAYAEALRSAIRPGAVVLDVGTALGILAVLACKFGARRVYAVEPNDAINGAREIAELNGCAQRIEFIQDLSTRVTLREWADVIVSDLLGVLPLFGRHLPSIADARWRHLASGGVLIPRRGVLHSAVVEAAELHSRCITPWGCNDFGVNLGPARCLLSNTWYRACVTSQQLLTESRQWTGLDYTTLDSPNVGGSLAWTADRTGSGHGLVCWFDAPLAPGAGFSNAPGQPELMIYGQAFFPWPAPVALVAGDAVSVDLYADLVGEDYVWRWNTRVKDSAGRIRAEFKQSTFFGDALELTRLPQYAADFTPVPTEEAEIDVFVLGLLCRGTPLGEIPRSLADRFPGRFTSGHDALTHVGILSEEYSR